MDEKIKNGTAPGMQDAAADQEVTVINRGLSYNIPIRNILLYPGARLAQDLSDAVANDSIPSEVCLKYNRNTEIFEAIVDFYLDGDFHFPKKLCWKSFEKELRFWRLEPEALAPCCFGEYQAAGAIQNTIEALQKDWEEHMDFKLEDLPQMHSRRLPCIMKMWIFFEDPQYSTPARLWSIFSTFLLATSLVIMTVISLPNIRSSIVGDQTPNSTTEFVKHFSHTSSQGVLNYCDCGVCILLLLEYLLRFISCPSKRRFVRSPKMILSLVSIIPSIIIGFLYYASVETNIENNSTYVKTIFIMIRLRVLRVIALARYDQYYPTMRVLFLTVRSSVGAILLIMASTAALALFFGGCLYYSEGHAVSSIPSGMWWAAVTMTTVGYGDMYPNTPLGKFIGIVCFMAGILILLLPIPVISANYDHYSAAMTGFQEIKKKAHKSKKWARNAVHPSVDWDENKNSKSTHL